MDLHKAMKEIVTSKGTDMIYNIQIINYLLDYQAFKEKPATKLILRDVINAGYGESILALQNDKCWQIKLKQYQHEFIDSCGYKEDLAVYVFESLAYALGLSADDSQEPEVKSGFNVESFFEIPEIDAQQPENKTQAPSKQNIDPTDLYTIAQSFYNEGKYQQARSFIEKAICSQPAPSKIAHMLKLLGDIQMMIGNYEEAIKIYNDCFNQKAKEGKYAIDILKNYFKQHKIKGYENVMFCYFFCLYGAKKMNDAQWLQFVKSEARYGLFDALKYCAENGINPVDDHYDIYFTDRGLLKSDDYLYDDGTFSHENSISKHAIARIYFCPTSDFEKSQGWTHGYIIPLEPIKNTNVNNNFNESIIDLFSINKDGFAWAQQSEDLSFPHPHYTVDDLNHWDEINKVESEHFIKIVDYANYPAFDAVRKYPQIPISGTSQWFLPSIHTCRRIRYFSLIHRIWTSSQSSATNAVLWLGSDMFMSVPKQEKHRVLPVAAF